MEVLLLQDIPGIGKKDDLLIVGDGYALNNLLPMRKALVATPTVRRRYAEQIRRRAEEKEREVAAQRMSASQIVGKKISFTRKATKKGKLYAAITEKHLSDALRDQLLITVDEKAISISEPIKTLGMHEALITLAGTPQKLEVEVTQEK